MKTREQFQSQLGRVVYDAYPDASMLPLNPPADGAINTLAKNMSRLSRSEGDSLFEFIVNELNDDEEPIELILRLVRAQREIGEMINALLRHLA